MFAGGLPQNQRLVSSGGVSSWHVAIPLHWTARADTDAIISATTTQVARAVTSLLLSGRMLCLQPADICKLLLQWCARFEALCITAYGFFFLLCFCQYCATFKRLCCGCAPPIHLADVTTQSERLEFTHSMFSIPLPTWIKGSFFLKLKIIRNFKGFNSEK